MIVEAIQSMDIRQEIFTYNASENSNNHPYPYIALTPALFTSIGTLNAFQDTRPCLRQHHPFQLPITNYHLDAQELGGLINPS